MAANRTAHSWFYSLKLACTTAYLLSREERYRMSVNHSVVTSQPDRDPLFTHIKADMTVIIEDNGDWWMADMIHVIGSVRNPKLPRFFQVVDVDTRVVRWIKADLVTQSSLEFMSQ